MPGSVTATDAPARASVSVTSRPLWRLRAARELPRLLVLGAAAAGLAACARFAIAPPRPLAGVRPVATVSPRDLAAEGFAQLFARLYLTWEASDPEAHERALAPFIGAGMEPDAGLQPPASGEEQVLWAGVVQERPALPGERVYTVAAQTDTAGLVYLVVTTARFDGGALRLVGYPAFVGAPATAPALMPAEGPEVTEPALHTVVERALRNYLADAGSELAADLTSAALVSLPARPLSLETVSRLDWAAGPPAAAAGAGSGGASATLDGAVDALVQAQDAHGARYTLAYQLDLARVAGRWEVAAIEMDPDT